MKPIIFSTPMVQAILDGKKTQTRRVIKDGANRTPQNIGREKFFKMVNALNNKPFFGAGFYKDSDVFEYKGEILTDAVYFKCPYKPGDVLWVRETWSKDENGEYVYRANYGTTEGDSFPPSMFKWKSSIHMPREAARIFLKVKEVSVERLIDISDSDVVNEGFQTKNDFFALWDKLNYHRGFGVANNPFVWKIEFERVIRQNGGQDDENKIMEIQEV